jgi:hypothetical protein
MLELNGNFFLGRIHDAQAGETSDQYLLYEPDDLTTHAVVVGMTGSGKTGLCIDLLEEAALNNIPALMIDPKGDITNTLLHFPNLLPEDFQPWVNPDEARREGKTIQQAAADAAALWTNGLGKWDIGADRLKRLEQSAYFAVYTPGSNAGIPVSILASLKAPEIPWLENVEVLREKISGTVTALLGLVGLTDIDPVRSREHILLSNIFESAWSQSQDLSLGELILQIQNPPFEKLGVFDIDSFYPENDRFDLSMLLNNILAAPAFQSWIEGQPLDIQSLLYGPDGRPRHSVFYIAHLSDTERMFFVALLYGAVETWMRAQKGITTLRALLYFDEIFGYLPPVGNPPSKTPMLRMLKQARAFGVGQVLVTQNPVDVDYKALSNAGSWFIGKLQTERDKERLLEGLEGAAPGIDRSTYDQLISTLDKRVFLLHNVHESAPVLFRTRWAMNYLAGPLTRTQLPALNEMVGAGVQTEPAPRRPAESSSAPLPVSAGGSAAVDEPTLAAIGSLTRPNVPSGVGEYFLPNNLTLSQAVKASHQALPAGIQSAGMLYRPALMVQANVRFLKRNYNLDYEVQPAALVLEPDQHGGVRWAEWMSDPIEVRSLDRKPLPDARFSSLEPPFSDSKTLRGMEADFTDWIYYEQTAKVLANESLKIYAGPQVSESEFSRLCQEAADEAAKAEIEKTEDSFDKKIDTIKDRLRREERELQQDETELSQRKLEEVGTHVENVLSLFSGRRRKMSTSLSKRRMTSKAKADVEESLDEIDKYKREIEDLEKEKNQAIEELKEKWVAAAAEISEIPVAPYKKDIHVSLFGIAWFPYHLVQSDGRIFELPAYSHPRNLA